MQCQKRVRRLASAAVHSSCWRERERQRRPGRANRTPRKRKSAYAIDIQSGDGVI